ncbi:MAG: M48 family metallopeptidase [Gemmataceae bacterium]|nr:M48 family metallopeptidase [Gemmataceae bacterium]MDW8266564.1 M48 family metallopeptidase [Gemmataceae bacterium]
MPFLLLLALSLVCMPVRWPESPLGLSVLDSALLTGLSLFAVVLATLARVKRECQRLATEPAQRDVILHRYGGRRFLHLSLLLAVYGTALLVFGWGRAVQDLCTVDDVLYPGAELLILAPFLIAQLACWAVFWDLEHALHRATLSPWDEGKPFWGRWAYVGFHVRQNLSLVLVPLGLFIAQEGTARLFPTLEGTWWFAGLRLSTVFGLLLVMPGLLRHLLGWQPLPAGMVRDRLEALARRLRFRCRDILVWPTRGGIANALLVGLLPRFRYVVLTDRLLRDLEPTELEAVLGHEIGHVKHHHMLYYLGFMLLSILVIATGWSLLYAEMVGPELAGAIQGGDVPTAETGVRTASRLQDDWRLTFPLVPVLGAYVFVVFGFLSRRCERQADIWGCRAVSCAASRCQGHTDDDLERCDGRSLCPTGIRTFTRALDKVAALNGMSRHRPGWLQSWLHSTIARRIEFLEELMEDPGLERRFQRRVTLVKWGLLIGLTGVLVLLVGAADQDNVLRLL